MEPDAPRLNYEGLGRAFEARGARGECPICDGTAWGSPGPLGNLMGHLLVMTPDGEYVAAAGTVGGIPVFVLTCVNCGFIRLHDPQVLAKEPKES